MPEKTTLCSSDSLDFWQVVDNVIFYGLILKRQHILLPHFRYASTLRYPQRENRRPSDIPKSKPNPTPNPNHNLRNTKE